MWWNLSVQVNPSCFQFKKCMDSSINTVSLVRVLFLWVETRKPFFTGGAQEASTHSSAVHLDSRSPTSRKLKQKMNITVLERKEPLNGHFYQCGSTVGLWVGLGIQLRDSKAHSRGRLTSGGSDIPTLCQFDPRLFVSCCTGCGPSLSWAVYNGTRFWMTIARGQHLTSWTWRKIELLLLSHKQLLRLVLVELAGPQQSLGSS